MGRWWTDDRLQLFYICSCTFSKLKLNCGNSETRLWEVIQGKHMVTWPSELHTMIQGTSRDTLIEEALSKPWTVYKAIIIYRMIRHNLMSSVFGSFWVKVMTKTWRGGLVLDYTVNYTKMPGFLAHVLYLEEDRMRLSMWIIKETWSHDKGVWNLVKTINIIVHEIVYFMSSQQWHVVTALILSSQFSGNCTLWCSQACEHKALENGFCA